MKGRAISFLGKRAWMAALYREKMMVVRWVHRYVER